MMRRFVKDESGMTLGLSMMMITLIGVMGAGLLTFVSKDLNSVLEVNRGQRAFELADAGVEIARRQLTDDCAGDIACIDGYDSVRNPDGTIQDATAEDIQWSWLKGGVTLNDLDDDDDVGGNPDRVHVAIDFQVERDQFKIISTGTYGEGDRVARRKIEAILKGVGGTFGGEGIGHPLYYTPSDITIEGDPDNEIQLQGISIFTKGDIIMEGFSEGLAGSGCSRGDPINAPFKTDYENTNCGIFHVPNSIEQGLRDWDSTRFADSPGTWNTVGRLGYPNRQGRRTAYDRPGFAAEGRICAVDAGSEIGECRDPSDLTGATPLPSIADGVYGYDSTTGTKGNNLAFAEKINCSTGIAEPTRDPNGTTCTTPAHNIISYPFPQLQPREKRLALIAQEQEAEGGGGDYYRGCSPPWETMLADATENSVFFIDLGDCVDANGDPIPVDMTFGGTKDGIMVVWCGDLHHTNDTKYRGILMNLIGDGSSFGSSNCEESAFDDPAEAMKRGVYRIDDGSEMFGWLYSEGGTRERSGIELGAGTILHFRSGADWNFLDDVFSGTPPTGFSIQSWRECYEREEDPIENARVC